jgi:hypothetical protein
MNPDILFFDETRNEIDAYFADNYTPKFPQDVVQNLVKLHGHLGHPTILRSEAYKYIITTMLVDKLLTMKRGKIHVV